jgi:hypothetical protein
MSNPSGQKSESDGEYGLPSELELELDVLDLNAPGGDTRPGGNGP